MTDVRLDEVDLAGGMVLGSIEGAYGWPADVDPVRPIEAVEAVVLAGLERPPCLVSFSGGRDSSALLAVAVRLADREGFSPTPRSRSRPGFPMRRPTTRGVGRRHGWNGRRHGPSRRRLSSRGSGIASRR